MLWWSVTSSFIACQNETLHVTEVYVDDSSSRSDLSEAMGDDSDTPDVHDTPAPFDALELVSLDADDLSDAVDLAEDAALTETLSQDAETGPRRIEGRILFERRLPDPTRSFLDLPFFAPLSHHLVEVIGAEPSSALTDAEGRYSLDLSSPPSDRLTLVVSAVLPNADGPPLIAVFDGESVSIPGVPGTVIPVTRPWAWSFDLPVTSDPVLAVGDLRISSSKGSGALAILDTLSRARALALAAFPGHSPPTLGVLWSPQRAYSCLSCYLPGDYGPVEWATPSATLTLDRALFVSGTSATPHHWVTPILNHELGHWVSDAFSRLPKEGGPHAWDSRVRPELAFAEGFATFFSLWALAGEPTDNPSRFFSIQQNIQYWIDFERFGEISSNLDFEFPLPSGSDLAQTMNESVIVATLWDLLDTTQALSVPDDDPCSLGDITLEIIAHPRLATASIDRGAPGPDLVDYLDALACDGRLPDSTCLDVALFGFPYDGAPLCPESGLAEPSSPR